MYDPSNTSARCVAVWNALRWTYILHSRGTHCAEWFVTRSFTASSIMEETAKLRKTPHQTGRSKNSRRFLWEINAVAAYIILAASALIARRNLCECIEWPLRRAGEKLGEQLFTKYTDTWYYNARSTDAMLWAAGDEETGIAALECNDVVQIVL